MNLYFWENALQVLSLTCGGITLISGVVLYNVKGMIKDSEKVQKELDKGKIVALENKILESKQKIISANATFSAILNWDIRGIYGDTYNSSYQGNAGYLAFIQDGKILLIIRSSAITMKSDNSKTVHFNSYMDLSAPGSEVNTSLVGLKQATVVQIGLPDVKEPAILEKGSGEIIFNSETKLKLMWNTQSVSSSAAITLELAPLQQMGI